MKNHWLKYTKFYVTIVSENGAESLHKRIVRCPPITFGYTVANDTIIMWELEDRSDYPYSEIITFGSKGNGYAILISNAEIIKKRPKYLRVYNGHRTIVHNNELFPTDKETAFRLKHPVPAEFSQDYETACLWHGF